MMEETLGKRIVGHRKRLGLTQDQLAEQLGITAQAVSKWENDLSCPDITMLPKLARIFGVTTDALLGVRQEPIVHEAELVTRESDDEPEGIHAQKGDWEFHWDGGRSGSLGFAVLVLLVGSLLLAGRWLQWHVGFWDLLWPCALLVFGLGGLYPRFRFLRLGCALCGGWFLAEALGLLPAGLGGDLVFPVMLVLFGLSLLAEALRKPRRHGFRFTQGRQSAHAFHLTPEGFTCENCFGENQRTVELPRLSQGSSECSFGDLRVDLSGCETLADDCHVCVNCAFGSVLLLVPRRFRAEVDSDTSFADVETVGQPDPGAAPIHLDCSVSFGSVTIRYI